MLRGRPVVLLDVDDVVCRCVQGMADVAGKKLGVEISESDVKTWDFHDTITGPGLQEHIEEMMSQKGWCRNLVPFPGAINGVKSLMEVAEIFFVTAPFHGEHWMHERREWLYHHFGIDRDRVLQGHSKFLVRGELFIDDKVENLMKWQDYGDENGLDGQALLWDRPYNRTDPRAAAFSRFTNWDQVRMFVAVRWPRV